MNRTEHKRFLSLADFIEDLPPENFRMTTWADCGTRSHFQNHDHTAQREVNCGTSCCVAGWAAVKHRKVWARRFGFERKTQYSRFNVLRVNVDNFAFFYGLQWKDSHDICLDGMRMTTDEKAEQIRTVALRYFPNG